MNFIENLIKKIHRSVFIKLIFVLFITGLLINLTVASYHFFVNIPMRKQAFHKNVENYLGYIIKDIGSPPNFQKAKEIAKRSNIQIRYEAIASNSNKLNWTTSKKLSDIKSLRLHSFFSHKSKSIIETGWRKGRYYIITKIKHGQIAFMVDFHQYSNERRGYIIILIVMLSLILFTAYLVIRRILKPIKWLSIGVEEISKGKLEHLIPENRKDELGELASSFNLMTKRVREMVRSKEQLLLDVSHELRSPLTRAKVALEMVPEDKTTAEIKEDLREMEKMISEILESERLKFQNGKLNLESVNILNLVKEVCRDFAKEPIEIKTKAIDPEMEIKIDKSRIKSVLRNILENSVKYSGNESKPIEIITDQSGDVPRIIIKDSGTGIPEKDLAFIFEPFYRVDKSRSKKTGGYGLGLSLCKKIMEAHGGAIRIESKENSYTNIYLDFNREGSRK